MKLYRVSIGHTELFAAGIDAEDIYNRRESLDHTFAYLPIVIEEVKLDGYDISVSKAFNDDGGIIPGAIIPYRKNQEYLLHLGRDELKDLLKSKNIEFTPQWGEQKLRELAIANV